MRILFCSDTFPGRFGPMASAFAAEGHEVLFASHYGRRDFALPGVRRVLLKPARRRSLPESPEEAARQELSRALATSRNAAEAFATLRQNGFVPDMCVFSSSSGAALSLARSWPESVLIGCGEGLPARASREEAEALHLRLRACLAQAHACFAFSEDRVAEMPPLLRRHACLLPPAVDTEFFSPQAASPFRLGGESFAPGEEEPRLVTVDMRSLPAASSPALWNICAGLLAHLSGLRLLMNCADAAILAKAEAMAAKLPPLWRERLFFSEFTSLHEWRDMLCASSLHIFPEALSGRGPLPEVLEAMSCSAVAAMPEGAARTVAAFLDALPASGGDEGREVPPAMGTLVPIPNADISEQFSRIIAALKAPKALKAGARCLMMQKCSQSLVGPEQVIKVTELYRACAH